MRRGGDLRQGPRRAVDALATITDLSWHCVCVGSLDRDPAFVEALRRRSLDDGLGDRVWLPGPRTGADLDRTCAAADLLVLASRAETYGIVVEYLARGLPVVATDVGGLTEALGHGTDGIRPGLVPPDDPAAGAALRAWLGDAELERAAAPGRLRAARVASRVVDHHVCDRRCPGRGVAMTVEGIRVSGRWLAHRGQPDAAARAIRSRRTPWRHLPATGRW